MKILHINDYAPETAGGAEVLMAQTVRLLRERGVDVEVFTSWDLPAADGRAGAGGNGGSGGWAAKLTPWRYLDNHQARAALRKKLLAFQPDVVHLHNFYHVLSPGILAELAQHRSRSRLQSPSCGGDDGAPLRIVMTAHDYHLACPSSGATWFARSAKNDGGGASKSIGSIRVADATRLGSISYLLSRCWDRRGWRYSTMKIIQHLWNYRIHRRRRVIDCVICPSRFLAGVMRSAGGGTSSERGGVGVPTMFLPYPSPTVANVKAARPDGLRLVFAGRVEPEKGLREFLELLPLDFQGAITIIGEGSELERCLDVCRRRKFIDRIEFTGRLSHEQAMLRIASCHVAVLPSLWWENFPLSLLEALALGTNILVSDMGGMREAVETADVGFTFRPGDAESLRAALEEIVQSHRRGKLNSFVVSPELSQRTEQNYIVELMNIYRDDQSAANRSIAAVTTMPAKVGAPR